MASPRRSSLDFQEQCRSEEVEAKRWMDRASRYLTEGRFESAIQLLQKTENVFPNCKNLPELMAVTQVCYAATWRACHCARPYTRKLPDWYHVLKVDERADFETIKKRYRQLALLLHPDKNKHVNSEGAFKIITEAYACLSDKEKRDIFNLERRRGFCTNCNLKAQLHAAGHVSRPVAQVHTPQTPNHNNAFGTPKNWESENLQNLRERAKSTVNNLEREFGGKSSKWMQHLASVRQRYWNLTSSPVAAEPHSTMKPDPLTRATCQEYAPRTKVPSSPISQKDSTPKTAFDSKQEFNTFEARRACTSDAQDESDVKLEENLEVLLNRLRAERSAGANESPLSREFGVFTRTPEAGHLLRPLRDRRPTRSSSVDRKCDAGILYSTWMPKGRCLSKKAPHSPTVAKRPSTVHVDRTLPRMSTSEHIGQTTPVRSSSVRLESLYPTSPFHPKDETQFEEVHSTTPVRSSSVRLESFRRPSLARKDENLPIKVVDSAPPMRSSSVRLENLYPSSSIKMSETHSKAVDSATAGRSSSVRLESFRRSSMTRKDENLPFNEVGSASPMRSSSVRLENLYPASPAKTDDDMYSKAVVSTRSSSVRLDNVYQSSVNKEDSSQQRSRSIARTASGSWSNRVKAHPELFDDVFTTVIPSTSRTPIRKQTSTYVLKTSSVAGSSDASPNVNTLPSKLFSDQTQKRVQRVNTPSKERISSTENDVKLASRVHIQSNTGVPEISQDVRPPLGSRNENLTSYSSSNQGANSKMANKIEKGIRASQLEHVENKEQKQKSEAINGILERLRAESKTVAATLDRLRDNVGAEALARPEYV